MSRKKQPRKEIEITLDRRFLLVFLGGLAIVLALGLGVLVGQLRGDSFSPAAVQRTSQQPVAPQSGQTNPQLQGDGQLQTVPQPQSAPSGQGGKLTEEDAAGLSAGGLMQDPCYVINLLEIKDDIVRADYRVSKQAGTSEPHPQLAIEGLNSHCGNAYDFGRLEPTEVAEQTLTLKNVGDEILTVSGLYTSCGCTVAQIEGHEVGPNGILSPMLKLEPGQTKEFVITLDASRVEDSAQPRIVQVFSDDPRGVPFGAMFNNLLPTPLPDEEVGFDKELRFAVLVQVGAADGGGGQ